MDGDLEASTVPSVLACDLKGLSLDRLEAFVLSQIDGSSSLDELASLAGLPIGEVRRIVRRLHELGTVNLPGHARRRASQRPPAVRRATSRAIRAVVSTTPESTPVFLPTSVPHLTGKSVNATGAREAFLLAQVDGRTSVSDLAAIAGLEVGPLTALLNKLARAGALTLKGEGSAPPASSASAGHKHDGRTETPAPRPAASRKHDGRTETPAARASTSDKRDGRPATSPRRASTHDGRAVTAPRRASSHDGRAVGSRRASSHDGRAVAQQPAPASGSQAATSASRSRAAEPASPAPAPRRIPRSEAPPRSRTQRPPSPSRSPPPRAAAPEERPPTKSPVAAKAPAPGPAKPAAAAADDGVCELEPETQARVTELYDRLATSTHYEMLGVAR